MAAVGDMVSDMDAQRRAEILERAYRALEPMPEREPPPPEDETYADPAAWKPWTPRQVEPPVETSRRREVLSRTPDAVLSRQLDNANAAIGLLRGELEAHKTNTRKALDALADIAGAETGKCAKLLAELQSQLNEARGEIALLKGLQPKRLLRNKSGAAVHIEGSLSGHAASNFN